MKYCENYQNVTQRTGVSKCWWKNGADRFAQVRVATNLQFMKIQYLQNARKRGMPVGQWNFVTVVGKTRMLEQEWKLLNPSLPFPDTYQTHLPALHIVTQLAAFVVLQFLAKNKDWKSPREQLVSGLTNWKPNPAAIFPAFLNSQEGSRRWGTEVRGQGSRSFFLLRKAELCGWRNCIGYRAESAGSEPLGDGFPLPL